MEDKLSRRDFLNKAAIIGAGVLAKKVLKASGAQATETQPVTNTQPPKSEIQELPSQRKVIIRGLKGDVLMSSVGPAWKRLGTQRNIEGQDMISEGVPVVNEVSREPGGIWIDQGENSNIAADPENGVYIPVFAAPPGHDLVIDLGAGPWLLSIKFTQLRRKNSSGKTVTQKKGRNRSAGYRH